MIQHFERPDGLPPTNGYSHDALAQARQVFGNLERALGAAGARPSDVIRLTFYLTDLADLDAVRTARDEFTGAGPQPASSLVQVGRLVLPDARIEVDALAVTEA